MALTNRDTALTTLRMIKLYLEIDEDTTIQDPHLTLLIQRASGFISAYTGRKFAQATITEYFSGDGTPDLYLPSWPITQPLTSTQGIWEDSLRVFGSSTKLQEDILDGTGDRDYVLANKGGETGRGRVIRSGVWPLGDMNIKVTWQGGYATIPPEIEGVCLEVVATWHHIDKNKLHAVESSTLTGGAGSITVYEHSDLPAHIKKRLDPWRRARLL